MLKFTVGRCTNCTFAKDACVTRWAARYMHECNLTRCLLLWKLYTCTGSPLPVQDIVSVWPLSYNSSVKGVCTKRSNGHTRVRMPLSLLHSNPTMPTRRKKNQPKKLELHYVWQTDLPICVSIWVNMAGWCWPSAHFSLLLTGMSVTHRTSAWEIGAWHLDAEPELELHLQSLKCNGTL